MIVFFGAGCARNEITITNFDLIKPVDRMYDTGVKVFANLGRDTCPQVVMPIIPLPRTAMSLY